MPKLEIALIEIADWNYNLKKIIQEALYLDHMALPIRPTPQVIYTTPSVKIIHIYTRWFFSLLPPLKVPSTKKLI